MRTETISLTAALLLHAGLLAARFLVHTPAAEALLPPAELRTIDIDSIEPPRALPPQERPSEPLPAAAAAAPLPANAEARRPSAAQPGNADPAAEPAAPSPEPTTNPNAPPGRAPDHYDGPPDDGHGVLGVPGMNGTPIWAMPGVVPTGEAPRAAPTEAPKPRPVDKDIAGTVIREAMRSNDKHLGLDLPGAGTVASSVQQAVYSSDTPDASRASIEVRLGADGKVLSVRVASFNGGSADMWARVANAAAAALRSKTLKMNEEFAKGGTIYVDVTSVSQLPDGSSSAIRPSGLGATFDVSDIGAHARRVVKTSFRAVAAR